MSRFLFGVVAGATLLWAFFRLSATPQRDFERVARDCIAVTLQQEKLIKYWLGVDGT